MVYFFRNLLTEFFKQNLPRYGFRNQNNQRESEVANDQNDNLFEFKYGIFSIEFIRKIPV